MAIISCLIQNVAQCTINLAHASDGEEEKSLEELSELPIEELADVTISPFELSAETGVGYRAANQLSATRFEAPINELPFAIQAFNSDFIGDQKPVTVFDIAKYSPGVTYRSNDFNEGNANVAIRGFAVSATPGNVQILRDGFHGPSILDLTNIDRVEVVKGPSSFLYGQVAPGGIVNVITKTPQPDFSSSAEAYYGSYNEYRFQADVTGPASKKLFYRLATSYFHDMNYWDEYGAHSFDIAPALLWSPTDRWRFSLKYEHYIKRENAQLMQKPGYDVQSGVVPTPSDPNLAGVDVPGLPDSWNGMSNTDFRNSDVNALTTSADFKASDRWNLRIAYSHLTYDIDAAFTGNYGMPSNTSFTMGRRFRRTDYDNHDDTIEANALGQYQFDWMSLRLLLGAQYVDRSFDSVSGQAPNNPAYGNSPASPLPPWNLRDPSTWNRDNPIPLSELTANLTDQTTTYRDKAIYTGSTFGFFHDRLLVLAGLRYTASKNQVTDQLLNTAQLPISGHKFTPQYGILYKLTPSIHLFGSYAESFVASTQILTVRNVPTVAAAPTTGSGFDVGVKANLFDGRVSGTLTFYRIENENIVNDITSLDPATGVQVFTNVQSGKQRSLGIELDATVLLSPNWQTYLSYSYMDAKIVEFSGNDKAVLAQDPNQLNPTDQATYKYVNLFHNAPLQMSAPHLANLWTRYDFSHESTLKNFYLGGGFNLVIDQTLLPDTPKEYHQTYVVGNALLGYKWRLANHPLNIEIMGKNLGNAYYRPSQSTRSRPLELLLALSSRF